MDPTDPDPQHLKVLYLDHEGDAEDRGRQAGGEQVPHTALR